MKGILVPAVIAAVVLAWPGVASAQSRGHAKKIRVSRAASVWTQAPRGAERRYDDRDSDSDSDSDLDSDSDSDGRRGRVLSGDRYPGGGGCGVVERELDRAHDEWHRRNDRYAGDRRYEAEHDRLHDRMDDARRREGCRTRGDGESVLDVILGRDRTGDRYPDRRYPDRRYPDRRYPDDSRYPDDRRTNRGDGGLLDVILDRAGGRGRTNLSSVLGDLLGGG